MISAVYKLMKDYSRAEEEIKEFMEVARRYDDVNPTVEEECWWMMAGVYCYTDRYAACLGVLRNDCRIKAIDIDEEPGVDIVDYCL
jgi:hypothetical protein